MRARMTTLVSLCLTIVAAAASAQPSRGLDRVAEDPESIGLDRGSFERLFTPIAARVPVPELREEIESLAVFFDPQLSRRGLARAELRGKALEGRGRVELPLAEGPVTFNDLGAAPDRQAGDGVFTAAVAFDAGRFVAERVGRDGRGLRASGQEVPTFEGREVVKTGEARMPEDPRLRARVDRLRQLAPRAAELRGDRLVRLLEIAPDEPLIEIRRVGEVFDERIFGLPGSIFALILPGDVSAGASLMVTAVPVVEDPSRTFDPCTGAGTPGGPWTFAHLMTEMATGSGLTPEDFTLLWLNTWLLPQAANGFIVNDPARGMQLQNQVIDPWIAASGGTPDIRRFPARLLAIVNRPDLANASGYGAPGSGGEGRFVFGLLDPSGCSSLPFTVIFEYGIDVKGCTGLKAWHQQWKDLDLHPVGGAAYNAALEAITRQFTDHGADPTQLPNQNALSQLRTNEIALGVPWELREFTLQGPGSSAPGELGLVTVKQTPDLGLNNTPTLSAYIAGDSAAILANQHVIPTRFPTLLDPFLGAVAPTPNAGFFWEAPGVLAMPSGVDLRHKVSLATCSGCHAGETRTRFTHIGDSGTRTPGTPASLSGFLTGMSMPDPGDATVTRNFNDLAFRQQALADVLNRSCFRLPLLPFLPAAFVH